MDTLTHALSGALAGRAFAPSGATPVSPRDCVALGFAAAAFPDADVVLSFWSPLAYLYNHRGVTHSLLLLPLWAFLLGWLWSRIRRNPDGLRVYSLIAGVALLAHILGDLINSFGTMILAPLSDRRFELGTTFVIDLWFSGIIVAGLLAAWVFRHSRAPAVLGLVVLAGYVGFQWVQKERALEFGEAYAAARGLTDAAVTALPRPVSPFNWMVVVAEPDAYHFASINLRRSEPRVVAEDSGLIARIDAAHLPGAQADWSRVARFGDGDGDRALAEEAWGHTDFAFFRWFAALPMVERVEHASDTCVWFRDLRFYTPGRGSFPFRYAMCRDAAGGTWRAFEGGVGGAANPL